MNRIPYIRQAVLLLVVVAIALGAWSCAKTLIGPSDHQTTSTPVLNMLENSSTPIDSAEGRKDQMQSAAAAVGQFDAFPSAWRFPFKGSSKITVGYNGNSCGLGFAGTHTGKDQYAIDWSRLSGNADIGDPLYAPASGWATAVFSNTGYGNHIRVDAGNGYSYLIGHMNTIALNYCGWISKGQLLGTLGCSGYCDGAHVHFVVYKNGWSVPQSGISGQWDLRICSTYSSGW